jgi:nitronate monooxygenase
MENGDTQDGIWSAGMVQGLIHDVPTVKELVDRIVAEAEQIIEGRLQSMISRYAEAAE